MASIVLVALKGLFKQFTVLGKLIKTSKIDAVSNLYETFHAIWYHLYDLKNVKNTHGGVLPLVKLQASICNFTKSNTHPWVFFTFLKLYKLYQIAESISYEIFNTFLMHFEIRMLFKISISALQNSSGTRKSHYLSAINSSRVFKTFDYTICTH